MNPALPSLEGLPANRWTWTVRRAVCLARGGLSLEEAAKKSKADLGRVKEAWAVYSETPEGKCRIAANARVKILGAEERAKVEAELKARDGAPGLRAEVEQLRQRLAQTEGLAAIEQQGREAAEAELEKAREQIESMGDAYDREGAAMRDYEAARAEVEQFHLDLRGLRKDYDGLRASLEAEAERVRALEAERDAAREEVGRLRAALADSSKLREAERRAALGAGEAQGGAEARAKVAEAEVRRLAAQVRGIEELVVTVRGLAGAYPSSCESCGCPTSRTRALVEQRDRHKKRATEAKALLDSYQADWEELAARRSPRRHLEG